MTDEQAGAQRITAEEFQELAWRGVPFVAQRAIQPDPSPEARDRARCIG